MLLKLHYMFPKIQLNRLGFFYAEQGDRYDETKEFLLREFLEYYEPENKRAKFVEPFISSISQKDDFFALGSGDSKYNDNYFDDRLYIDSGLKNLNSNQLQEEFMKV